MGRGTKYKYTPELLAAAARESTSIAGVLRHLGIPWSGGMHAHISRRLKHFQIDTSHFTRQAHNRGKPSPRRLPPSKVLVIRPAGSPRAKPHVLRRALREMGVSYCCAECGLRPEWQGRPLILHVDHISADHLDCRLENLRFLCPNCHSQTASWAGRNKGISRRPSPPAMACPIGPFEVLDLFGDALSPTMDNTAGVA